MLTIMFQIRILRTPYIKTYRLPTPILIFQLALIPGSLLAGFLLSPLLYLSRHLAQRPNRRLRLPHEKPIHRRLLALGFYAGAALVCGGLVGTWTQWCLGWRNPFMWIIYWLVDGRRGWTRPALISYWGLLAAISVAGWNRQLVRGRRHRRYVVPGTRESTASASGTAYGASNGVTHPSSAAEGLSGVATQMMDAADQKMPILSVNSRRKFFHALAVVMFVPGIAIDVGLKLSSFFSAFCPFAVVDGKRAFLMKLMHLIAARIHPPVIFRRFCSLQLCRIYPLLCPMAIWSFCTPLSQRVSRCQRLGDSHLVALLLARGMCGATMAGGTK